MRELARRSTEDYSTITSLDQINRQPKSRFERGYPGQGTAEWWALRLRYEDLLGAKLRRERSESKLQPTFNEAEAVAAKWSALGNETADRDYQSCVRVIGPNKPLKRRDWLDLASDAIKGIRR
jgi:hypothetical protein